ncbi:hypothetical protein Holit_02167 [Hollandina sp. SP2]
MSLTESNKSTCKPKYDLCNLSKHYEHLALAVILLPFIGEVLPNRFLYHQGFIIQVLALTHFCWLPSASSYTARPAIRRVLKNSTPIRAGNRADGAWGNSLEERHPVYSGTSLSYVQERHLLSPRRHSFPGSIFLQGSNGATFPKNASVIFHDSFGFVFPLLFFYLKNIPVI